MFEVLQQKWKVSAAKLALILLTFAVAGSATGYLARKIMGLLPVDKGAVWILVYILTVTILWPVAVIIISIPFGQFLFFRRYLQKMGKRLAAFTKPATVVTQSDGLQVNSPEASLNLVPKGMQQVVINPAITRIAVFASGGGTNTQCIIDYFRHHPFIVIALVICNKPGAGVLEIARKENIPTLLIEKEAFNSGSAYLDELKNYQIDFIALAGFLWKIPVVLIKAFPQKIINIHPALLPAHGGKGMYGHKVHEAVIAAGENESGITIHYVDEIYDHGQIIFQARCPVLPADTPLMLASKIHALEHAHFPRIIEQLLTK